MIIDDFMPGMEIKGSISRYSQC